MQVQVKVNVKVIRAMGHKYEKTPALPLNLFACADISPDTKEIHLFYWNTGENTSLLDLTFGRYFWTLHLDVTIDVTFGHHFWKNCIYV